MIIAPKIRGFICTTAHPVGCAKHVAQQIAVVKKGGPIANGPKKVLVIGSSTGYGLSSRIAAAFGSGAATIGVFFERPGEADRTATASRPVPALALRRPCAAGPRRSQRGVARPGSRAAPSSPGRGPPASP